MTMKKTLKETLDSGLNLLPPRKEKSGVTTKT